MDEDDDDEDNDDDEWDVCILNASSTTPRHRHNR